VELRSCSYPFHKVAIEQEAIRKGIANAIQIQQKIRFYHNDKYSYDDVSWFVEAGYINAAPIIVFILLGLFNILINFIYLFFKLAKQKSK